MTSTTINVIVCLILFFVSFLDLFLVVNTQGWNNDDFPKLSKSSNSYTTPKNTVWSNGSNRTSQLFKGQRNLANLNVPISTTSSNSYTTPKNTVWFSGSNRTSQLFKGQRNFANLNVPISTTPRFKTKQSSSYPIQTTIKQQNQYLPNVNGNSQVQNSKPKINSLGPNNRNTENTSINENEDNELREFAETLLKKDVNNAAKYVQVNYQSKTTSRSLVDEAPQPLLTLQPEVFNISTISKLIQLHNNYIIKSSENEESSPQEKLEEINLIDSMLPTSVMQHTRNYLIEKGKIGRDPKEFRDLLRQIWFNMYSRGGGKIGSSGFEHVFLVEIKNNGVSGLHNWIYFNSQELNNKANYLGYMKKIEFANKGAIVKYHFKFDEIDKPVGSMFIGTSPELEIALYTTCFILRPDSVCPLKFDGHRFIIRTYTYKYRGKKLIGSAFPEI